MKDVYYCPMCFSGNFDVERRPLETRKPGSGFLGSLLGFSRDEDKGATYICWNCGHRWKGN